MMNQSSDEMVFFRDSEGKVIQVGDTVRYKNKNGVFKYISVDSLNARLSKDSESDELIFSLYLTGKEELSNKKVRLWRIDKSKVI